LGLQKQDILSEKIEIMKNKMKKILDLHIHSKYSRACSKELELPQIAKACEERGIDIVVTGDFTHPLWFDHIKKNLIEDTPGIYKLKDDSSTTRFLLGTEIASIKKHKGKTRRIHLCLYAPSIEVVEKFNATLNENGFNLKADGRPILGMTSKDILQMMLSVDERMVMIPAHAWTPWFGIFGSNGGYDSLEEAFEELAPHIFAVETGLSSDPQMNWQWKELDTITLVSNSDAHSLQKLGREANVFNFQNEKDITYENIVKILQTGDKKQFQHTIEFYPEEGKYHADGHRDCQFYCDPKETKKYKGLCPKCKKPLVIGVLNRVNELSERNPSEKKTEERIPYKSIVPLPEILADVFSCGVGTKKVKEMYSQMIKKIGNEFFILNDATLESIEQGSTKEIRNAIERMRSGNIYVRPGYDGEFGVVKIFEENNRKNIQQLNLDLE